MSKPEYVRCRTLGHAWDDIPVTRPPEFGAAIDLRCIHCYTVRRDIVSRYSGRLISRQYTYPDEYKDSGDDRPGRNDYRVQWLGLLSDDRVIYADDDPDDPEKVTERRQQAALRIVSTRSRRRRSA